MLYGKVRNEFSDDWGLISPSIKHISTDIGQSCTSVNVLLTLGRGVDCSPNGCENTGLHNLILTIAIPWVVNTE